MLSSGKGDPQGSLFSGSLPTISAIQAGRTAAVSDPAELHSLYDRAVNFRESSRAPIVSIVADADAMTVSGVLLRPEDLALLKRLIDGETGATFLERNPAGEFLLTSGAANTMVISRRGDLPPFDGALSELAAGPAGALATFGPELVSTLLRSIGTVGAATGLAAIAEDLGGCVRTESGSGVRADLFAARARTEIVAWLEGGQSGGGLAASLVGLGPGLTPSGDDFLAGLLAGLDLVADSGVVGGGDAGEQSSAIRGMLPSCYRRTTDAGATILMHACDHAYPAYLLRAVDLVIAGEIREALSVAGSHGASSGLDALTGFAVALLRSITSRH